MQWWDDASSMDRFLPRKVLDCSSCISNIVALSVAESEVKYPKISFQNFRLRLLNIM